ncbi:MAG: Terminal oxidase biogenesis protein CtaM, putative heme A, heme O chaperone, partial [uncultured Cytophagales bacterium]
EPTYPDSAPPGYAVPDHHRRAVGGSARAGGPAVVRAADGQAGRPRRVVSAPPERRAQHRYVRGPGGGVAVHPQPQPALRKAYPLPPHGHDDGLRAVHRLPAGLRHVPLPGPAHPLRRRGPQRRGDRGREAGRGRPAVPVPVPAAHAHRAGGRGGAPGAAGHLFRLYRAERPPHPDHPVYLPDLALRVRDGCHRVFNDQSLLRL